jgi:hypothetical protein
LDRSKRQIDDREVQTVWSPLAIASPPFVAQFQAPSDEISEALDLAVETNRALISLFRYLEEIENVCGDMEGLVEVAHPVFHLLYLNYWRTRPYHWPRHICALLCRVSDFFAGQFAIAIDGGTLVSGDPAQALEHPMSLRHSLHSS